MAFIFIGMPNYKLRFKQMISIMHIYDSFFFYKKSEDL